MRGPSAFAELLVSQYTTLYCIEYVSCMWAAMYRRKRRCHSGGRVHGPTAGVLAARPQHQQQQQQQQDEAAASLVQLNSISSPALAGHSDMTLVHNPYYQFTDPAYCLHANAIDRNSLTFHRQVLIIIKRKGIVHTRLPSVEFRS